jgi:hypothetical protein
MPTTDRTVGWSKNIGDPESGEIEFNFKHPHPLDANLWFYGDQRDGINEWILDLAWMEDGFVAGKEVHQRRERMGGLAKDEQDAKVWASGIIREYIAS